jgi:hypothetical protein
MALNAGDTTASSGLAKAIYDNLVLVLGPSLEAAGVDMNELHAGWQKLSYAIAMGVVSHLTTSAEVYDVTVGNETQDEHTPGKVR